MSFEKIPYDKQRMETLRIRLENHARVGEPIAYAATIDGVEIIPRTTDASLFSSLYELLGENTRTVSISEYSGNTRNRNTICFWFPSQSGSSGNSLNGIETMNLNESIDDRVRREVEQANLKITNDRLNRENQTLKNQLKTLLDKNDEQEEKIKELNESNAELAALQNDKSEFTSLVELGKDMFGHFTGNKKAEDPLSGTPKEAEQAGVENNGAGTTHFAVPESEYKDFKYFASLFQSFDPVQRGLVSQLITLLGESPELVEETYMTAFYKTQQTDENEEK